MKNINVILLALLVIVVNSGCSSSDDTVPNTDGGTPPPAANPIPGKTSTYNADVQPIFEAHCVECHGNPPTQGAPVALSTYQEIIIAINQEWDVFGRVSTTSPLRVMPQSGRLPQETVDIILDWQADGLLEE
ncbi:hypothetical protein [Aquimarina mytili]|uniref:Cytochrome c domain-containing protein n=1 Tax=Aquimarina mytili TaxID=874423 RepID=A0A936ZUB9_9FLAO|nr:hypothetical protein [Aquimarina mytili]MBL0685724.1 hypothetical protein [Aquimarina mytili]